MANKRVFYSALFCDPENLSDIPSVGRSVEGWDAILFTNIDIQSEYWTIKKIDPPIPGDFILSAKTIKWLPHIYLQEYEIAFWMDCCWSFDSSKELELNDCCAKLSETEIPCFITKHTWVLNIYNELEACLRGKKVTRELVFEIKEKFEEEGVKSLDHHYETKSILRKIHNEKCIEISYLIIESLKSIIYRDQVVLPYILWKHKIELSYLPDLLLETGKKINHTYTQRPDERKIAICFWGLTRSLQYTISSINKYLLKPLEDNNIEYDIYLHTYDIKTIYKNKRAGENNIQLKNQYYLLQPKYFEIEDQAEVDSTIQFSDYHSQGDPWPKDGNNFETLNNHIRALRSLSKVTAMWYKRRGEYTHVIYCRPDVEYISPIDTNWFQFINTDIFIPNFALYKGVNDRFCIARPNEAYIYGSRFKDALEYSQKNKLHAEFYLSSVLNLNKIKIQYIDFLFKRVRANGEFDKRDITLGKKTIGIFYSVTADSSQVIYFLKNGVVSNINYQYYIIGDSNIIDKINKYKYLNCNFVSRPSKGGHFGAWSEVLLYNKLYMNFDYCIFINDDCIGPFLPSYVKTPWPDLFISKLNEVVKLVGPTITTHNKPKTHAHIDTYCFAMSKKTVKDCIKWGIFSNTQFVLPLPIFNDYFAEQMPEEYIEKTIKLSRNILKSGASISSFCKYYQSVDFRFLDKKPEDYGIPFLDSCNGYGNYNNSTLHPYEVMFLYKTTPFSKIHL